MKRCVSENSMPCLSNSTDHSLSTVCDFNSFRYLSFYIFTHACYYVSVCPALLNHYEYLKNIPPQNLTFSERNIVLDCL